MNSTAFDVKKFLIGKMVKLRSPKLIEMDYIRWLWSDSETMKPVGGPVILSDKQAVNWFSHWVDPGRESACYFLIFNKQERPVGEISFRDYDAKTGSAMFNVKIAADERGKGFAREAMKLFLNWYFLTYGGKEMIDDLDLKNTSGQKALLRSGFSHVPTVDRVYRLRMTREEYSQK